ncbi:class III lanthionine synthetase LanKC, partial [Amycolatopsis pigmentata]
MTVEKLAATGKPGFAIAKRTVPEGWRSHANGEWVMLAPDHARTPAQGWKVHVSACLDNADEVLESVWDYCLAAALPFKYLAGRQVFFLRNSKYANRGGSGKLVTIYPADDVRFKSVLEELDAIIGGQPGPYVLSDLRWNDGPLYVRYGGFAPRFRTTPGGDREPVIEAPDETLVPDRRDPVFTVPPWVDVPGFLEPALAARNAVTLEGVPYVPEQALHFSNGGGVYLARSEKTGEKVVLKEARPHAGLAPDGSDAVARLRRERDVLRSLEGAPGVPGYVGYFTVADHEFLVEEFIEGQPLSTAMRNRNPLMRDEMSPQRARDYASWALRVCAAVESTVTEIHARGFVVGDLHSANILVADSGEATIIDFEVAAPVAENRRSSMGNPGFVSREPLFGPAIDRYALACLRLFSFLPLTPLLLQDAGRARLFAEQISAYFPVPADFLDEAVATIIAPAQDSTTGTAASVRAREPSLPMAHWQELTSSWEDLRRSMSRAIVSSATPDRDDRLFPGDIQQFTIPDGGLGMAYGAAGVLYALSATGTTIQADHEEWLVRRADHTANDIRPGFYDGLHGLAFVLDHLGHHATAANIIDRCLSLNVDTVGQDLFGGLAGIGLNLAHLATRTGDSALRQAAVRVTRVAADRLAADGDAPTHPFGLMRGACGPGLLFIRMAEHTSETGYLDLAAAALERDLRACLTSTSAGWALREPTPRADFADGMAGLATVLRCYLAHRENDRFADAVETITRAVSSEYTSHAGLFTGRAGVIAALVLQRHLGEWVSASFVVAE